MRWFSVVLLGLLMLTGCSGNPAEARARSCFEHLSLGNMDATMQCIASDRRERFSTGMERISGQLKGCHTKVTTAQVRETGDRAEVLLKFSEPCGEPPSDANGRQVTGVGVGLVKEGGAYYVTEFERAMD